MLLAGPPRSGTTLACELLNRLDDVRALDEPMPFSSLLEEARDKDGVFDLNALAAAIGLFADRQRRSILERGVGASRNVAGRVMGHKVSAEPGEDGLRRPLAKDGEVYFGIPEDPGFTLVMKHPMLFTAQLPALSRLFRMAAMVRNPLATLASWQTVPFSVREGRLGIDPEFAPEIHRGLQAIDERVERQIKLLTWLFARIASSLDPPYVIRYEDLVASGGRAMAPVASSAAALSVPLQISAPRGVDPGLLEELRRRLLASEGDYWRYYARSDVEGWTR